MDRGPQSRTEIIYNNEDTKGVSKSCMGNYYVPNIYYIIYIHIMSYIKISTRIQGYTHLYTAIKSHTKLYRRI